MFDKFITELVGTFIFLTVIIISVNTNKSLAWLQIGLALSVCILFTGIISGGHMNPAVSLMFYLNESLSTENLFNYWIAQFMGAALAYFFYINKIKNI
jgi:glycerol uptake facilitator-like aquaporin